MSNVLKNLFGVPFNLRQSRLARSRQALSETEFVQRITDQGGDREAALALWTTLKDWTCASDFTPYPTDSLGWVFGIAEEELDEDLVLGILRRLDVTVPNNELLAEFGAIDTPLRVAQLVALCRKHR